MYSEFEKHVNETSLNKTLDKYRDNPYIEHFNNTLHSKRKKQLYKFNFWEEFKTFLYNKYKLWMRCIQLVYGAIYCLSTNKCFKEYLTIMRKAEKSL